MQAAFRTRRNTLFAVLVLATGIGLVSPCAAASVRLTRPDRIKELAPAGRVKLAPGVGAVEGKTEKDPSPEPVIDPDALAFFPPWFLQAPTGPSEHRHRPPTYHPPILPPAVTEHRTGPPPPPPDTAPEPATLLSGVLGAALLGLYTRRRAQRVRPVRGGGSETGACRGVGTAPK